MEGNTTNQNLGWNVNKAQKTMEVKEKKGIKTK